MSKPNRREIMAAILDEFPDIGNQTAANVAMKRHPNLWPTQNAARMVAINIRRNAVRDRVAAENVRKKPIKISTGFPPLPAEIREFENWGAVDLKGEVVGVLSDVHIPYHDKTAVDAILKYFAKRKVDTILLNGDIIDFYTISRHEPDPRQRKLEREITSTKQFLAHLRGRFPKAKIAYKTGNHEERWTRYLAIKAPELLGVQEFEFAKMFGCKDLDITVIDDRRRITLGQLSVLHGHEYRFAIANPVNPARGLFLRAKKTALCSHFHQVSSHSERTLGDKLLATWSIGCACYLHPHYHPYNNWSHGAAVVEVAADGDFEVTNFKIIEGKCVGG